MPNISLTTKGGGHYDEDLWFSQVVSQGLYAEWWVLSDNWEKFLDNLRGVNFGVSSSRSQVSDYVAALDRDLPADVDRRFAGPRGQLGSPNYVSAPIFYRINRSLVGDITRLARITDQPSNNRDVELSRVKKLSGQPTPPPGTDNQMAIRDVQSLRDGSLSFSYTLINELVGAQLAAYTVRRFETEFGLQWLPVQAQGQRD
ncbi:beta-A protein [Poa semilatent virus]|uniref:Beta-A protein n=1 Tax=Poa semilatent virus TaxID=12328 RepID=Q85078_9VIRU|nr:beta-A protein [Poa semilatent virus]AAB05576.1 beta-A protein [Poa semilatent virus]